MPGGRPPKYKNANDLQKMIDKYFAEGVRKKQVVFGSGKNAVVIEIEVPTITGLVQYCGFESRQSFYDLQKQEKFSYTIKKARLAIENIYEEALQQGNTVGAIFALKNFGWIDKQEIDMNTTGDITVKRPTKKPSKK